MFVCVCVALSLFIIGILHTFRIYRYIHDVYANESIIPLAYVYIYYMYVWCWWVYAVIFFFIDGTFKICERDFDEMTGFHGTETSWRMYPTPLVDDNPLDSSTKMIMGSEVWL